MDSDSDQDEEDKHRSLSVTINEGRSICNIGRRVGSECSIVAVECVSASESITQCSVENVDNFTVTEIMSDDDLTDSVTFAEDEETKEPPFKIIRVSCKRQVLRELISNIADDRVFTAEKNMDDVPDPNKSAQDNQKASSDRENISGTSPDSTTATNAADPTNPSNSSEQSPAENKPESGLVDTMETPSSPVHTSLVTPDSMEATHSPHATSSVSPGPAETPSPAPVSVATPDSKGTSSSSIPASHTIPNKRESQEEKLVDPVEGKLESSSDHAVQSCTSNNNLPHENPLTEETVGTLGAEDLNPNLPGSSDTPVPIAGLENVQSSSAGQLAGKKRKHSAKKTADTEGAVGGSSAENSVSSGDAEESFENKDSDKEAKKKKNRCAVCRKKVGLTGFECRCGGLFCAVHRYSDKHDCTFDYREMGAQEIRRNNPVVVGEKIQKI